LLNAVHDGGMRHTFIKQSIGINPLLSARDWLVLFGVLSVLVVIWLLLPPDSATPFARGALFGAIGGSLPTLLACLPVRGTVAADRSTSFFGRVEQAGFVAAGETAEGRIYLLNRPRWIRWDSNRIVVRTAADGALQVTAPFYFYWRLKRMQS
jgi:hypothetical protein